MSSHDWQQLLDSLHSRFAPLQDGSVADYIPELSKANPESFGLAMATIDGQIFESGDSRQTFTLQSVSKPFVYGLALADRGRESIHAHVGVEPTGEAFNSLIELEEKSHRPYNPMVNAGAIAVTSLIEGRDPAQRLQRVLSLFQDYVGHPLHVDMSVFLSEKTTGHRNRAIAHLLHHFGVIGPEIEATLDLYFQQCSILADTRDLALMAATLANGGVQPVTGRQVIPKEFVRDLLSLMFTCGMYDSAGEWAYTVGLPAKSGVSGALIAVVPGKMGIATYSPRLDSCGHSIRGLRAIAELSSKLNLNIFTTGPRSSGSIL